jgi:hypothetical protein
MEEDNRGRRRMIGKFPKACEVVEAGIFSLSLKLQLCHFTSGKRPNRALKMNDKN